MASEDLNNEQLHCQTNIPTTLLLQSRIIEKYSDMILWGVHFRRLAFVLVSMIIWGPFLMSFLWYFRLGIYDDFGFLSNDLLSPWSL